MCRQWCRYWLRIYNLSGNLYWRLSLHIFAIFKVGKMHILLISCYYTTILKKDTFAVVQNRHWLLSVCLNSFECFHKIVKSAGAYIQMPRCLYSFALIISGPQSFGSSKQINLLSTIPHDIGKQAYVSKIQCSESEILWEGGKRNFGFLHRYLFYQ